MSKFEDNSLKQTIVIAYQIEHFCMKRMHVSDHFVLRVQNQNLKIRGKLMEYVSCSKIIYGSRKIWLLDLRTNDFTNEISKHICRQFLKASKDLSKRIVSKILHSKVQNEIP